MKALHRSQAVFTEILLLVSLLSLVVLFVFALIANSQKLPNLAEILPAEGTEAFLSTRESGEAWVNQQKINFLPADSVETSLSFYLEVGKLIAISESREAILALQEVQNGAPNLESNANYQNAKSRLPYLSDTFIFINEPAQGIQVIAATIEEDSPWWYAEVFVGLDKDQLSGEELFQQIQAYTKDIQPGQETELLDSFSGISGGTDGIIVLDMTQLAEKSILDIVDTYSELATTYKIFDDGLYFRSLQRLE